MKHIIKQIKELIPVSNEPLSEFDLGYTKGLVEVLKIINKKKTNLDILEEFAANNFKGDL